MTQSDPAAGLASMTGFARSEGSHGPYSWAWELKSVNNRGLDVRLRVPGGYEAVELEARKRIGQRFKRGSIQIGLQVTRAEGASQLRVNEAALDQVLQAVQRLRMSVEAGPPSIDGLLGLRGVLEVQDPDENEDVRTARNAAILESFETGLTALAAARAEEGAALGRVLTGQIDRVAALIGEAEQLAALQPDKIRKRLEDQLAQLVSASATPLPEERIAQEAAVLMTKADIREEIDRLKAHTVAACDLLAQGEAVGRRLDFLIQEFNRESNTLCAKSPDMALTRIGLDLKAVVDQMREQVQNIE